MNRVLAFCAAVAVLPSCGIFTDRSNEYREAGVIAPMVLPEGVKSGPLESVYAVPDITVSEFDYADKDEKLVVPRPSPMSQDSEYARVKIQKVGERRWVLAEAPTSQVWPLVQSFLARNGILVDQARPKIGEIETGWLGFKVDANTKTRYRIQIEKGVREESSEVHVLHQQVARGDAANTWPATSSDPEREAWLLDELSVSIAQGITNRAASLLGQSVGGDEKIALRRDGEEPVLEINLDKERAEATVAQALTKEGLVLWAEEMDYSLFYFAYDDPSDEPGWWKKITFRGNDDVPTLPPVELRDRLNTMSPSAAPIFGDVVGFAAVDTPVKSKGPSGYLLRGKQEAGKMVVRVRNVRGETLPYGEAKELLIVIRRNLI